MHDGNGSALGLIAFPRAMVGGPTLRWRAENLEQPGQMGIISARGNDFGPVVCSELTRPFGHGLTYALIRFFDPLAGGVAHKSPDAAVDRQSACCGVLRDVRVGLIAYYSAAKSRVPNALAMLVPG